MTTDNYTTETRVLRVVGTLWSGVKCSHEYPLREDQSPATLADAKLIAGDFESLSSAPATPMTRWWPKTSGCGRRCKTAPHGWSARGTCPTRLCAGSTLNPAPPLRSPRRARHEPAPPLRAATDLGRTHWHHRPVLPLGLGHTLSLRCFPDMKPNPTLRDRMARLLPADVQKPPL